MESIVRAIEDRLPSGAVRLNSPVTRVARNDHGKWQITVGGDSPPEVFDAIVVAAPARRAAELLTEVDRELGHDLAKIQCASSAVVSVGYLRDQIAHPLDGFGFVVPIAEGRRTLAVSFSSIKYTGRAPARHELLRAFVGGACQGEMAHLPDDELQRLVHEELTELLGVRGAPMLVQITRWPDAMPQYHVGHVELVAGIERRAAAIDRFALAGNAYHGVGVPQCIHSGEQAAERILKA